MVLACIGVCLGAGINDHEGYPGLFQFRCCLPSHPPESGDDDVISQFLDFPLHSFFSERVHHAAHDQVIHDDGQAVEQAPYPRNGGEKW
jgi:hypothetical protein